MSKYSRLQEQRVWDYLKGHPDIYDVTYYGSRQKNKGDFLFWVKGSNQQVRSDHKSTTNDIQIRLLKSWLQTLTDISLYEPAIPIITFSLKGCHTIYAMGFWKYKEPSIYKKGNKSCVVRYKELSKWVKNGGGCIAVNLGFNFYIYTLDSLIECIKES